MDLFLMRHGDALPQHGEFHDDSGRTLSPEGIIQVEQVAQGLKRQGVELNAIVSSPLVRARQTAEIVGQVLDVALVSTLPALAPSHDFKKILSMLRFAK